MRRGSRGMVKNVVAWTASAFFFAVVVAFGCVYIEQPAVIVPAFDYGMECVAEIADIDIIVPGGGDYGLQHFRLCLPALTHQGDDMGQQEIDACLLGGTASQFDAIQVLMEPGGECVLGRQSPVEKEFRREFAAVYTECALLQ